MARVQIRAVNTVWWHFFWRYAIVFILLNASGGIIINYGGIFFPAQLYIVAIFFGIFANLAASLLLMIYCFGRKFKGSDLVLHPGSRASGFFPKLWSWFLYFWRFILLAFVIGFALGTVFPIILKWLGVDPIVSLKYSKYLGMVAILPASYLAFLSLSWRRKEKNCRLRIAVVP